MNQAWKEAGPLLYNIVLTNPYYKHLAVYTERGFENSSGLIKSMDLAEDEPWHQALEENSGTCWWHEDGKVFVGRKIVAYYPKEILGMVVVELKPQPIADVFQTFHRLPAVIEVGDSQGVFFRYGKEGAFSSPGFESRQAVGDFGLEVYYCIASGYYSQNVLLGLGMPMLVILLVLCLAWYCVCKVSEYLIRDLSILVEEVNEVQKGNFDVEIKSSETEEIHTLAENIRILLHKIKQLIRQVYAKEIERKELELDVLQAKISPHFLYNNLSAINWLALECGEEKISQIATEMADFYRTALNKGENIGTLKVEIANIKAYVNLQLIAHENSFEVQYEVDDSLLSQSMPVFILQPLVENAIEHGIDELEDACGQIRIRVWREDGWMRLEVWDNGVSLFRKLGAAELSPECYGYGTRNVHKRIQLLYGEECSFCIVADEGGTLLRIGFAMDRPL